MNYKARRYPLLHHALLRLSALEGVPFRRAVQAGTLEADQRGPMVPATRGFHLDAFTSPFESLRTIVRQWKRADAHRKQTGSMAEVISFQTGRLALPVQTGGGARRHTGRVCGHRAGKNYDPGIVPAGAGVSSSGPCDVQDNRLEAEVSAWGLVEVARDDASQLKGWGSHEFRGLQYERALVSDFAAGRWSIAASTATPAQPVDLGTTRQVPGAARARTPAARCCAPLSSASTLAATTAPRWPSSAR